MNDIPRRNRVDQMSDAERHILESVCVVEAMGADGRLTDAVQLLQAARESVADFVDGINQRRGVVEYPEMLDYSVDVRYADGTSAPLGEPSDVVPHLSVPHVEMRAEGHGYSALSEINGGTHVHTCARCRRQFTCRREPECAINVQDDRVAGVVFLCESCTVAMQPSGDPCGVCGRRWCCEHKK